MDSKDRAQQQKAVNQARNQQMREKFVRKLRENVIELRRFARENAIDPKAPVPPNVALHLLDSNALRKQPYRDYAVSKFLQLAERTLQECDATPNNQLGTFHFKKLTDQALAIRNLLHCIVETPADPNSQN